MSVSTRPGSWSCHNKVSAAGWLETTIYCLDSGGRRSRCVPGPWWAQAYQSACASASLWVGVPGRPNPLHTDSTHIWTPHFVLTGSCEDYLQRSHSVVGPPCVFLRGHNSTHNTIQDVAPQSCCAEASNFPEWCQHLSTLPSQGMAVSCPSLSHPIQPKPHCPAPPPQAPPLALCPFSAVLACSYLLPPMPRTCLTGGP